MSNGITTSSNSAINKTRNAILRMKKCSPELRAVLRQRSQERIYNDRLKILNAIRKIKIQNSFKIAFGNILQDDWKDEFRDLYPGCLAVNLSSEKFNLEHELLLEELIEKELLSEYENWLLEQHEELSQEEYDNSDDVVCPLCCSGYLEVTEINGFKTTSCMKCCENFTVEKSLPDLQMTIYYFLSWHNKQCDYNPTFVNVPKSENENNLCITCSHCSFSNFIV